MAQRSPTASDETDARTRRPPNTGTPRWVKVFAVIAVVAVIGFAVLHLTGNSFGGPGMHGLP